LAASRSKVASSFTIIKGALIEETYTAFQDWDFEISRRENLRRMKDLNTIGATSTNWLRDVGKVLNRRFDPNGRDRALVELAKAGCRREIWKPLLLWHMTRDEFLVRDFFGGWLYDQNADGAFRLRTDDLDLYLRKLPTRKVTSTASWTSNTLERVASALLRMTTDFDLTTGTLAREFISYHLPEESFLYLLHAIADQERNPQQTVRSPDWRMYLMDTDDVERELLRLHQFHRLRYEVAGSLAELDLPCDSALQYAREYMR
jgi:hypothetical protein